MILGCVSGYNDAVFLEECLRRLHTVVDRIIYVDGAYANFPHRHHLSTDGSIEIAAQLADGIELPCEPWPTEVAKRNTYLQEDEAVWHLVVDCDEMVEGVLDESELVAPAYWVPLQQPTIPDRLVFRLFRGFGGIRYYGCHNAVCDGKEPISRDVPTCRSLSLLHRTWERDQERVQAKGEYLRWLACEERGFRIAHGY